MSLRTITTLSFALVLPACGDDVNPMATDGETTGGGTVTISTSSSSSSSSASATTDSTTTETPTTTESSESSSEASSDTTVATGTTTDTDPSTTTGMTLDCTEVNVTELALSLSNDPESIYESSTITPALGGAARDTFRIEFRSTEIGSFDLESVGENDDYATCQQCVLLFEDGDAASSARQYFQSAGTIDVDASSELLDGRVTATLTDVVLVEVAIDPETLESVTVEGGECLALTSPLELFAAPWNCDPAALADGVVCDCGCGSVDPDCDDANATSCDECNSAGSCAQEELGCDAIVDDDNSTCDVPVTWVCEPSFWNADDGCDCGCGSWDPDCIDTTVDACEFCGYLESCNIQGLECPGAIDPETNWLCDPLAAWRCAPAAYADGTICDCGCDIPDPDCTDSMSSTCDECNDAGSCAEGQADCDAIVADNNTACVAPPGWTCNDGLYDTHDGCGCGCGVWDPDCEDFDATSCDFCNDAGSCDAGGVDCSQIETDQNWLCD